MNILLNTFKDWNSAMARTVASINTVELPAALVDMLNLLIRGDAAMISLEQKDSSPVLLYDQGIPLEKRDLLIGRYFSRGYMLDPFCLAVSSGLDEGFYHLSEIAPDDFFNSDYYKTYYLRAGSVEDCYFVTNIDQDRKITVCLYHGYLNYKYSQQELTFLRAVEPIIRQLVLLHWCGDRLDQAQLADDQKKLERPLETAFMNFGRSLLTERELEITHLILRGHSSKSAARELEISPDTVREHRKNLYRKLNINSQSELFSLFIDTISNFSELSEDPLEGFLKNKAQL